MVASSIGYKVGAVLGCPRKWLGDVCVHVIRHARIREGYDTVTRFLVLRLCAKKNFLEKRVWIWIENDKWLTRIMNGCVGE